MSALLRPVHRPLVLAALLAAFGLAACASACSSDRGARGAEVSDSSVDSTPEAIATRAMALTSEKLAAMGRKPQPRPVEFVDSHTFGQPSPVNPQGLRVLRYRLGNGLDVLLLEDHSAPVFAYQTWFSVGSRHERPGITGIAHLFEHLMFKETKNLPEGEFDKLMESHGAQTNAATWVDWTMYREELPAGNLELVVRLEADRMENMILDDDQLESEREVVKNERRYRVDNDPEGTMFEVLYATAFNQHPYSWPTIGWMKDIEAISLDDCLTFYKKYYAPDNATVVLAGDFKADEALALINAYYGHMPTSGVEQPVIPPEPSQVAERRRVVVMPLSSPKLLYGYKMPGLTDDDHASIEVLHQVLFGGQSGRLYRKLVVETELAADASAWVSEFAYPGLYEILITLKEGGKPEEVEPLVNAELQRLADEPISQRELEKAQNQLEAEFLRNMQEVGDRAYGLGHYAITGGDYRLLFTVTDRYRAVTPQKVQLAAQRYLRKSNRTVVLAMPKE